MPQFLEYFARDPCILTFLILSAHGQIFVAIHTSSKTSENELVVTNRKHGQIVLGYKKLPPHASHFAVRSPSLAAIADGSPLGEGIH
mmetsp:Transcript_42643/g.89198  ORF Transcript_42643/g.89198 Transcript_42643/m.89198 type:complete len:87 (+) Transcript_42643:957-1217(+)